MLYDRGRGRQNKLQQTTTLGTERGDREGTRCVWRPRPGRRRISADCHAGGALSLPYKWKCVFVKSRPLRDMNLFWEESPCTKEPEKALVFTFMPHGAGLVLTVARLRRRRRLRENMLDLWSLVPRSLPSCSRSSPGGYSSLFIGSLRRAVLCQLQPGHDLDPSSTTASSPRGGRWNAGHFPVPGALGIMVSLINQGGRLRRVRRWAETTSGRVSARYSPPLFSASSSSWTTTSTAHGWAASCAPSRRHKISRAKLAYLLDATAAPCADRAHLQLGGGGLRNGRGRRGIELFVRHPYNLYSLLTFVSSSPSR